MWEAQVTLGIAVLHYLDQYLLQKPKSHWVLPSCICRFVFAYCRKYCRKGNRAMWVHQAERLVTERSATSRPTLHQTSKEEGRGEGWHQPV